MDGIHHELERGIDKGSRLFGIKSLNEGRRAFEVGKEGSNGFTFAVDGPACFHRDLLSTDTIGCVLLLPTV